MDPVAFDVPFSYFADVVPPGRRKAQRMDLRGTVPVLVEQTTVDGAPMALRLFGSLPEIRDLRLILRSWQGRMFTPVFDRFGAFVRPSASEGAPLPLNAHVALGWYNNLCGSDERGLEGKITNDDRESRALEAAVSAASKYLVVGNAIHVRDDDVPKLIVELDSVRSPKSVTLKAWIKGIDPMPDAGSTVFSVTNLSGARAFMKDLIARHPGMSVTDRVRSLHVLDAEAFLTDEYAAARHGLQLLAKEAVGVLPVFCLIGSKGDAFRKAREGVLDAMEGDTAEMLEALDALRDAAEKAKEPAEDLLNVLNDVRNKAMPDREADRILGELRRIRHGGEWSDAVMMTVTMLAASIQDAADMGHEGTEGPNFFKPVTEVYRRVSGLGGMEPHRVIDAFAESLPYIHLKSGHAQGLPGIDADELETFKAAF